MRPLPRLLQFPVILGHLLSQDSSTPPSRPPSLPDHPSCAAWLLTRPPHSNSLARKSTSHQNKDAHVHIVETHSRRERPHMPGLPDSITQARPRLLWTLKSPLHPGVYSLTPSCDQPTGGVSAFALDRTVDVLKVSAALTLLESRLPTAPPDQPWRSHPPCNA